MELVPFGPNRPERFYLGGPAIARFRGLAEDQNRHRPEDWLASTTTVFGDPSLGLTVIDGRTLRDRIAAEPEAWLGPDHVAIFGPDSGLLVKLLAPEQRLPIHAHPDRAFARRHLASRWGKTEAWYILDAPDGGGEVYLGWREPIDRGELVAQVKAGQAGSLLGSMHRLDVRPGDGVLVPAGQPHAIGSGLLLVELQEPTDFSILVEWEGFDIDGTRDGHLGLGFDLALQAVTCDAAPASRIDSLVARRASAVPGRSSVFPDQAAAFFRADRLTGSDGGAIQPAGFAVLVVTDGRGRIETDGGQGLEVRRGMTIAVPYGAGAWRVAGDVELVACRPPAGYDAT